MTRFAALPVLLILAACTPPPPFATPEGVTVATSDQVASCQPLSRLTTTPGVTSSVARNEVLGFARNETMEKAKNSGANTVVFVTGGPNDPDALFVEALTYVC